MRSPLVRLALLTLLFLLALSLGSAQELVERAYLPVVTGPNDAGPIPTATRQPLATATSTPASTPSPYPTAPGHENLQCNSDEYGLEICAWVSEARPLQNSEVTVYGYRGFRNVPAPGDPMNTVWHYRTTTSSCDGVTNEEGVASCTRNIGRATVGYRVNVDVTISGQTVRTWFTPR